jgi:hypothetical protein
MTVCQAFQDIEVIRGGCDHSRYAVKFGRRCWHRQNFSLILEVQTVKLRWRLARPRDLRVESVVQVVPGYTLLKARLFIVMTTPQNRPGRTVIKQHRCKECRDERFYMPTIHI